MASADTVKLISSEGHEFIVDRKAAMVSGTIKSMLGGPGKQIEFKFQKIRINDVKIIQQIFVSSFGEKKNVGLHLENVIFFEEYQNWRKELIIKLQFDLEIAINGIFSNSFHFFS